MRNLNMRKLKLFSSVAVTALLVAGCVTPGSNVRPLVKGPWNAGSDSASLYQIGKQHLAAKRFGLAIVHFDRMLAQNPESIIALNAIAATYDQLGRFDVSERYYKKAMRKDPNSRQTLNNIGYSYLMQKKFEVAQRYLALADQRGEPGEEASIVATNRALAESETTPAEARTSLSRWEGDVEKPKTKDNALLLAEATTTAPTAQAKVRLMRSGERGYKLFTRNVSQGPVEVRPAAWRIPARQSVEPMQKQETAKIEMAKASQIRLVKRINIAAGLSYLIPDAPLQMQAVTTAAIDSASLANLPAVKASTGPVKAPVMQIAAVSRDNLESMVKEAAVANVAEPAPRAPAAPALVLKVKISQPALGISKYDIEAAEPAPEALATVAPPLQVDVAELAPLAPAPVAVERKVKEIEPAPEALVAVAPPARVKVAELAPLDPVPVAVESKVKEIEPAPEALVAVAPPTQVKVAELAPLVPAPVAVEAKVNEVEPAPELLVAVAPPMNVKVADLAPLPIGPAVDNVDRATAAVSEGLQVAAVRPSATEAVIGGQAARQIQRAGMTLAGLLVPSESPLAVQDTRPNIGNSGVRPEPKRNASGIQRETAVNGRNPVVEVSNGAGRRAMAARVRNYLRQYGENAQRLTNAKSFYHAETVVLFKPGFEEKAQTVAELMPGRVKTKSDTSLGRSDVRLRLGWDLIEYDRRLHFSDMEI